MISIGRSSPMSFVNSNDHPNPNNPQDPLYYAPRSVRGQADPRLLQTRPEQLPVPRFDEIGEDAFVELIRPLKSQFEHERNPPRTLLATAGGIAAAIGVTAIVALVYVFPRSNRDPSELTVTISTPASASPAQVASEDSQSLLQRFEQFKKVQGSEYPEQAASPPTPDGTANKEPEKSQALLQKFIEWEQRK